MLMQKENDVALGCFSNTRIDSTQRGIRAQNKNDRVMGTEKNAHLFLFELAGAGQLHLLAEQREEVNPHRGFHRLRARDHKVGLGQNRLRTVQMFLWRL